MSSTAIDASTKLRREADRLQRLGVDGNRALQRASGTLLRRLPVAARRDIRQQYNLTTRRINFDLSARRAGAGAIDLIGRRRRIGLIQYGGRWGGRRSAGATVQIDRGGGRELWDGGGAFIATGLSGNRHIFERSGAKRRMQRGRDAGQMRQPLKTQYFGSIAESLVDAQRIKRLTAIAGEILDREMARLVGVSR